ncbi:MAG: hypothetical protein R6W06_15470 [Prochlorococcaceae cyanobacterium]
MEISRMECSSGMESSSRLEEGRYRVWVTALRTARFHTLEHARAFASRLFHDRDHVVILEKLAPNGCWLQLDQLA